ncbi:MAG: prolyl oligopeptidase family serine peptidase [Rubricoccaceae bacterium]
MRSLPFALAFLLAVVLWPATPAAQPRPFQTLTVDQIMQAPETWIGAWPSAPYVAEDGRTVYFRWNPQGRFESDSLFAVPLAGGAPRLVTAAEARLAPPRFDGFHADRLAYDATLARRVVVRDGDLWLYRRPQGREAGGLVPLVQGPERILDARFSPDGRRVIFRRATAQGEGLFALELATGATRQLADVRRGAAPATPRETAQQRYLREQQARLIETVRERVRRDSLREAAREREAARRGDPPVVYTGERTLGQLQLDPTERFLAYTLAARADNPQTLLADYVTRSGVAEEIRARPKVGGPAGAVALYVHDLARDTAVAVSFRTLPGFFDAPDFARARGAAADSARHALPSGLWWSPDGRHAVLEVRVRDNKDRWLARLDPATGVLTPLDRQRDEAWIAGPGIAFPGGRSAGGWIPESDGSYRRFWFQSERTGYSHLYTVDVETGEIRAVTEGPFEVFDPVLSRDGRVFYFQSSEGSPYERHVYRVATTGGARERLTDGPGRWDFALAPGEDGLALLHSRANAPPEVYVQALGRRAAPARRVTDSPTAAWRAYAWQDAEIIEIPASDGARVPARRFLPEAFGAAPNGKAVLFVHGAGYLQNVHRWWSQYFRETMFHHLLAARGYVVLDVDYRASAGYGRDWRTAIYRHMGGRDLQDFVDASRYLQAEFGIAPENVGIYGGSYGGFITLMALFTEAEHFGAGAALRAVTDWAHYNDGYTRNILNTPAEDPEAFERSSPIEFAEGLRDPLLMAHGLVDDNVQPQDIFRLVQRLIELRKERWELAVYPVEPHGFTEPTSWADQYRRILRLFEEQLGGS